MDLRFRAFWAQRRYRSLEQRFTVTTSALVGPVMIQPVWHLRCRRHTDTDFVKHAVANQFAEVLAR